MQILFGAERRRRARADRGGIVAVALLAAALAATSCDPCATVIGCTQAPAAVLVGQLVDPGSGRPVSDAVLEMTYVSGVALTPAVVTTRSRTDGSFTLRASAGETGRSVVRVAISQPGEQPYVIPVVEVESSRAAGDATVLHPWVASRPGIPFAIIAVDSTSKPIPGPVRVVFRRTSGPRLYTDRAPVDSVSGETDGGYIFLFNSSYADTVGSIVGTLTLRYAGRDTTLAAVFPSTSRFRPQHIVMVIVARLP